MRITLAEGRRKALDREKTVMQSTGSVTLFPDYTLAEVMEIVLDLGIDPNGVLLSAVTLKVGSRDD